ncbi:HMG box domain containing protein [Asbolus verrucosus]|uniref:HMG box domain containing protein n=1 Tax=Asbolus verrucosus TaxID=1661398 RepID=A0A482VHF8_ASBVE|nr:HMG box domain containing protein [Asbolus verrucosus]
MPKKRKWDSEDSANSKKLRSEGGESSDNADITKQSKKHYKNNISWTDAEMLQLISKIEESIPNDDCLSYVSRLEKIDWNDITFKTHSVQECQQVWSTLLKQVRKFRLLREIVVDMKDWVKAPKPSPAKNVVCRHPDKPKQPFNSYMLFVSEKRSEVTDKYPSLRPNDVSRKLGQMFKNLTMKEREEYEQRAKVIRQEYAEKLRNFYEEHPEMIPKKTSKRFKSLQLEHMPPEKPKTPFQLFVQTEAEKEATDASKFAFNQKCREHWNEMDDKNKIFWINWAEEQYVKYTEDLKEYIKLHPKYEPENIKTILTKKEKRIKARCSGKPEKPPHSPYHLFTKMMMESENIQKISNKDSINYISEKWKACSEEEKNQYKIRMKQMWEEYKKKMDQYLMTLPPEERNEVAEEEFRKRKRAKPKSEVSPQNQVRIKLKKPEVPPLSEYKYFLSVYEGKENPSLIWKNMSDAQKAVYKEELMAKKQNYIALYEEYLKSLTKEELQQLEDTRGDQYDTSSESEAEISD